MARYRAQNGKMCFLCFMYFMCFFCSKTKKIWEDEPSWKMEDNDKALEGKDGTNYRV